MLKTQSNENGNDDIEKKIRDQLALAGFDPNGVAIDNKDQSSSLSPEPESEVDEHVLPVDRSLPPTRAKVFKPKVKPPIDSRYIELTELPSRFLPYEQRSLYIRPFSVLELKLIARSIELNSIDYITQAIDNCIDLDVYSLTIPDYFYLYYWLRIESYPNTPYYCNWECNELQADKSVCGHKNVSPLTQNEMTVSYLESNLITDSRLDYPRVRLLEDLTIAALEKKGSRQLFSSDDLLLVEAAKWIKDGDTIFDKIKILESQPDLRLYESAFHLNQTIQYGVYEFTLVTCGRCGAKRRFKVSLDASKFFPFFD